MIGINASRDNSIPYLCREGKATIYCGFLKKFIRCGREND